MAKNFPENDNPSLEGKMLIAMPGMMDPRFYRTVIYMCSHSGIGAMGIIVNKPAHGISFEELLRQVDVLDENAPEGAAPDIPVHFGGPVEMGRGFVLHSTDYFSETATMPIEDGVGLTATLDVLHAISSGRGPSRFLLALGYAGWAPGQLDVEIQENGWLHCASDHSLLFGANMDGKYDEALHKIGVEPSSLSSEAGHA